MFNEYVIFSAVSRLKQDAINNMLVELRLAARHGLVELRRQNLTQTAFDVCLTDNSIFWDSDTLYLGTRAIASNINYFVSAAALARIDTTNENAAIEDLYNTLRLLLRQIYTIK